MICKLYFRDPFGTLLSSSLNMNECYSNTCVIVNCIGYLPDLNMKASYLLCERSSQPHINGLLTHLAG